MTRAPGFVERLLRSRRASTSRCISYSDGCLGRAAIDDKKKRVCGTYSHNKVTDPVWLLRIPLDNPSFKNL